MKEYDTTFKSITLTSLAVHYIYTYIYICVCVYVCVYHIYVYACVCACVRVCVCACVRACMRLRACVYIMCRMLMKSRPTYASNACSHVLGHSNHMDCRLLNKRYETVR